MARAETLGTLLNRLRAATGQSLNVALGVNMRDTLVHTLQAAQEELYLSYDWPFLKHSEVVTVGLGSYAFAVPETLNADRISHVYARAASGDDAWGAPLEFQDAPSDRDPGEGDETHALPAVWWRRLNPDTNEVFLTFQPRCDQQVQVKLSGYRPLLPFVDDADRSTLDGRLLVMAASAEILTRQGAKDAQIKQNRMQAYLRALRADSAPYRRSLSLGGGGTPYGGPAARFSRRGAPRVRGLD